jgi:hypothetical protein
VPRIQIVLYRDRRNDSRPYATGNLFVNNVWVGKTLEYPWRHNSKWNPARPIAWNIGHTSCIPEGTYRAFTRDDLFGLRHPHRQFRLELTGTGKRFDIEVHPGNTLRDSEGCILLGLQLQIHNEEANLLHSQAALKKLERVLRHELSHGPRALRGRRDLKGDKESIGVRIISR